MKCLLASLKHLLFVSKACTLFILNKGVGHFQKLIKNIIPESGKRMSVPTFLSCDLIGYFLQRTCQSRLSEQFLESPAAFGTPFRLTEGYPKSQNKLPEEGYW
jgi:hypothetical protein